MSGEARTFAAFLIFDFGERRETAREAIEQIERWSKAFKLHGQLLAREMPEGARTRVVVRLAFADFEELAFERWLERIPQEEVFTRGQSEILHPEDERFTRISRWFGEDASAFR